MAMSCLAKFWPAWPSRRNNIWNLVQAIRAAERDHFGGYLRDLLTKEIKGRTLLKKKRFRSTGAEDVDAAGGACRPGQRLSQKGTGSRPKGGATAKRRNGRSSRIAAKCSVLYIA